LWKNQAGLVRTHPDALGGGPKIIEHERTARELLIADLNSLRQDAGGPSLGQLVRLSQRKLSKSTLDDHLSGRRTRLPSWRLVSAYVSACHAAAAATGLDVERLGTLDEWHARWSTALKGDFEVENPPVESEDVDSRTVVLDLGQSTDITKLTGRHARGNLVIPDKPDRNSVSAAHILQQLEDDFWKLGQSLPAHTGLLIVTSGPAVGTRFAIEHNITTIGRDPESDIWLNDPTVSRRHAVICRHGGRFFADDSGSKNGTFIQRVRVSSETLLSSYEELRFAIFSFLFIEGGQSANRSLRKSGLAVRPRFVEDISASTHRFNAFAQNEDDSNTMTKYVEHTRHGRFGRLLRRTSE